MAFAALAAGASMAMQANNGHQARKAQRAANRKAEAAAAETAAASRRAENRASAKGPNLSAILDYNKSRASMGSTMLTGPGGVTLGRSMLGRTTLLGS